MRTRTTALAALVLGLGAVAGPAAAAPPDHAASQAGQDDGERDHGPPAHAQAREREPMTEDDDADGTPDEVPDEGDDQHPSGRDRSVDPGGDGAAAQHDPDDDGHGPDRSNGGVDQPGDRGGEDPLDQDGDNGCGNDDDFEDDNEGWCGRPAAQPPVVPPPGGTNTPPTVDTPTPPDQEVGGEVIIRTPVQPPVDAVVPPAVDAVVPPAVDDTEVLGVTLTAPPPIGGASQGSTVLAPTVLATTGVGARDIAVATAVATGLGLLLLYATRQRPHPARVRRGTSRA